MNYGEKIAALRKQHNMTQAELGKRLNVSFQAVSKWENGLSEPDLDTAKKMCEIFEISVADFFDEQKPEQDSQAAQSTEKLASAAYCSKCDKSLTGDNNFAVLDKDGGTHILCDNCKVEYDMESTTPPRTWFGKEPAKAVPTQTSEQKVASGPTPMAFCSKCKRPLYTTTDFVVLPGQNGQIQEVMCKKCKAEEDAKQKEEERRKIAANRSRQKKLGFTWGAIIGGILGIVALIVSLKLNSSPWIVVLASLVGIYVGFAFVSQLVWQNSVLECLLAFVKTFSLPGIIFTLDLDGILFLLTVKIVGSILAGLLSVCCFLFGAVISMIYSMLSFPFAVARQAKGKYDDN